MVLIILLWTFYGLTLYKANSLWATMNCTRLNSYDSWGWTHYGAKLLTSYSEVMNSSVIRCLIESDGELSHVDDQGRTPAHHAATAGGLEAIKALAHNDIDVNSRDTAGCVPAHYAAANNHCSCLGFLLGSGLAKRDVRDRTGRSLLHMVRLIVNCQFIYSFYFSLL